ncbi:nitrate reductase alpha subunit [Paraburkholderia sp. WC7.3g]
MRSSSSGASVALRWTRCKRGNRSSRTRRRGYQSRRGLGGFIRSTWDEVNEIVAAANVYTVKHHGPDRVIGFSPILAMSMVSYAAGSRYLSLIGGVCLSFYDWYCDLPPASPQTWGEQTDVPESADWYNSTFIMMWGSAPRKSLAAHLRRAGTAARKLAANAQH